MTMMRQTLLLLLSLLAVSTVAVTDLGGGIVTRKNVDTWANLALDVRDLKELLEAGKIPQANLIYRDGLHGDIVQPGVRQSLRSLSVDLKDSLNPNYLYHLYGLASMSTETFRDQSQYGDNYVQTLMSSSNPTLATRAIVVLLEWMYATHLLYQGIDTCQKRTLANNPDLIELGGGGMDEFIALWIGQNQTSASTDGHALYAWTQEAGILFGQDDKEEVAVNRQVKLLYQEGTTALTFANACTKDNVDTVPKLWNVVQRMVSQMTIPLMQILIYALVEKDAALIKLFALALVPQLSQCRPSVYKRLKEELLDRSSVNFDKVPEILQDLRLTFECLGMTCGDVPEYKEWDCFDLVDTPKFPLADYIPTTSVLAQSRVDLDLLQIKILTSLESYQNAKFMYLYGRNSPKERESDNDPLLTTSLHQLGISSDRQEAQEFYSYFAGYHNDANFADTTVLETLNGETTKWENAAQRTEVVVKTCAFQILYLYARGEMAQVLEDCRNNQVEDHAWDAAAAYLIGSLEGPLADVDDGLLFWNLANKRAFQFNTVNSMGYSKVNSELENLLFAGKGELDALDCDNLERTNTKIQNLLLVPIVQSTLRYAIANQDLDWSSPDKGLAEGEAFALSLLPVVAAKDEDAAQVIRENMIVTENVQPVRDGPQHVANVLYEALNEEMDCRQVGETPEIQSCSQSSSTNDSPGKGVIITLSILILVMLSLCGWVVYRWWRNKNEIEEKHIQTLTAESSETTPALENKVVDVEII